MCATIDISSLPTATHTTAFPNPEGLPERHPRKKTPRRPAAKPKPPKPTTTVDAVRSLAVEITQLRKVSPARPANFRWKSAQFKLEHGCLLPEWKDPAIEEISTFIEAIRRCKSAEDYIALEQRNPDQFGAWTLFESQAPEMRWEVEARILAEEPFDEIAQKMAMRPQLIETYERWFFAVLDRIKVKGYIQHTVIQWPWGSEPDLGTVWKHFGYTGGSVVLDAIIYGMPQGTRPASAGDIAAFSVANTQNTIALKAMMAAQLMPVTERTVMKILKLAAQMEKARAKAKAQRAAHTDPNTYKVHIHAFLDEYPPRRKPSPIDTIVGKLPPVFPNPTYLESNDELDRIGESAKQSEMQMVDG